MQLLQWCVLAASVAAFGCRDTHVPFPVAPAPDATPPSASSPNAPACTVNTDCASGLVCINGQCASVGPDGRGTAADATVTDAEAQDSGSPMDATATPDADTVDAVVDGGFGVLVDSGLHFDALVAADATPDAGPPDTGATDTGLGVLVDSGAPDTGSLDAAAADATLDASLDAAAADASPADSGVPTDTGIPADSGVPVDSGVVADIGFTDTGGVAPALRTVHIVIDLPLTITVAKDGVPGRAWFCHSFRSSFECDNVTFLPINQTTQRLDVTYVNVPRVNAYASSGAHIVNACTSGDCITFGHWIVRRDITHLGTFGPVEDAPMQVTVDGMVRERRFAQNGLGSFNWEFDAF